MEEGKTLFDLVDGMQRIGALPAGESWQFRILSAVSRSAARVHRGRIRLGRLLRRG